jgi:hypothetical protein
MPVSKMFHLMVVHHSKSGKIGEEGQASSLQGHTIIWECIVNENFGRGPATQPFLDKYP